MLNSTHMYIQNLKLFLRPSNSDTLESFALFQRIDPPSSARGLCFCYRPLYTCIHASRQCADGATEEFLQVVFNHDKGRFTFSSWKKLQNWAIVKERALRAPAYSPKTPMLCGEQFPARSKPVPPLELTALPQPAQLHIVKTPHSQQWFAMEIASLSVLLHNCFHSKQQGEPRAQPLSTPVLLEAAAALLGCWEHCTQVTPLQDHLIPSPHPSAHRPALLDMQGSGGQQPPAHLNSSSLWWAQWVPACG